MFWDFLGLVQEMRLADVLDVAVVSALLWSGMQGLRTARARGAGAGMLLIGAVFLVAKYLNLQLTMWLLQGIAAIAILVFIIVFQSEIRQFLERLPTRRLRTYLGPEFAESPAHVLRETLEQFSAGRTGALIVMPGWDAIEGFCLGGTELGGAISKPLLLSIFDASSPGHDGAVVLKGSEVARFGVRLPLSEDTERLKEHGLRHTAALGLAERCDALILIVSEETGRISVARGGAFRTVSGPEEAGRIIEEHYGAHAPSKEKRGIARTLVRHVGVEGPLAVLTALVLWLVLVPGSVIEESKYRVPVIVENIPPGYVLLETIPPEIEVTLSGARRNLYLFDAKNLAIRLDGTLTGIGRRNININASHLTLPSNITLANLSPSQVKLSVKKEEAGLSRQGARSPAPPVRSERL